jgi:hypothetical protein
METSASFEAVRAIAYSTLVAIERASEQAMGLYLRAVCKLNLWNERLVNCAPLKHPALKLFVSVTPSFHLDRFHLSMNNQGRSSTFLDRFAFF